MITIKGIELDFDITSPLDLQRYMAAGEKMEIAAKKVDYKELNPDDEGFFKKYIENLNIELRLYGDFLDEVFGDKTAEKLLTNNPSMTKLLAISEELNIALEKQGTDIGAKIKKYQPNRATRRKK